MAGISSSPFFRFIRCDLQHAKLSIPMPGETGGPRSILRKGKRQQIAGSIFDDRKAQHLPLYFRRMPLILIHIILLLVLGGRVLHGPWPRLLRRRNQSCSARRDLIFAIRRPTLASVASTPPQNRNQCECCASPSTRKRLNTLSVHNIQYCRLADGLRLFLRPRRINCISRV
jgi:hypothetical protein